MPARVSALVAHSTNLVIGKNGGLPWYLPDDLKRFKALTTGHVIIMGRKTHESIGRPLPNRTNIVITRDKKWQAPGCIVVTSLEAALEEARKIEKEEIFIIGGGQIYTEAMSITDRLYVTLVKAIIEGDVFFPEYAKDFQKVVSREVSRAGEYDIEYLIFER